MESHHLERYEQQEADVTVVKTGQALGVKNCIFRTADYL